MLHDLKRSLLTLAKWSYTGKILIIILSYFYIINFFNPHIIDAIIDSSFVGALFASIYKSIITHDAVAIITFLFFLGVLLTICFSIKRKNVAMGVATLFLLVCFWIFFDNYWIFPLFFLIFSFKYIYSIGLFIVSTYILWNTYTRKLNNTNEHSSLNTNIGFTDENLQSEALLNNDFAKSFNTNLTRASYAVGISGSWGTGKTVFLQCMKKYLPDPDLAIEFNPWLLFEVLRLIRNTADFPNLVYVVAYDRQYVERILRDNGIEKAHNYLEKIFNVEIEIPKASERQLQHLFMGEFRSMGLPTGEDRQEKWSKLMSNYLHNYREVRRFCRHFTIVNEKMLESLGEEEYLIDDLFILELIRYVYPDIYDDLKYSISNKFDYNIDEKGVFRFMLPSEEKTLSTDSYNSDFLIHSIFFSKRDDRRSIRYVNNYQRYFTYDYTGIEVSAKKIRDWVETEDETMANEKIHSIQQSVGKGFSILFQIAWLLDTDLEINGIKRIINVLLPYYFREKRRKRQHILY